MDEIICECGHTQYDHTAEVGCLNKVSGTLCECLKSRYDFPSQADKNDELPVLRSLLSDAMKALEPFAEQVKAERDGSALMPTFWASEFRTAAEVAARIKATLTGGE